MGRWEKNTVLSDFEEREKLFREGGQKKEMEDKKGTGGGSDRREKMCGIVMMRIQCETQEQK